MTTDKTYLTSITALLAIVAALLCFLYAIVSLDKKQPPSISREQARQEGHDDGWREGVQWFAEKLVASNVFLGPLVLDGATNITVSNCVFLSVWKSGSLVTIQSSEGFTMHGSGNIFWAGAVKGNAMVGLENYDPWPEGYGWKTNKDGRYGRFSFNTNETNH